MSSAYEKALASGYSHHLRRMGWPEDELIAQTRRFIRAVKAQAWDEGYEAGSSDSSAWGDVTDGYAYFDEYEGTPNPYREDV